MKQILVIAMLLVSAQAFAAAAGTGSGTISCKTPKNLPQNAFQAALSVEAKAVRVASSDPKQQQIVLRDVKMTAKADGESLETGRAKTIDGQVNPRATKYKEYYTAKMDKLVDVKSFGQYEPIDECYFTLYLPTNMWNKSRFEAPVVTHCDQNGGSQTLDCDFTK